MDKKLVDAGGVGRPAHGLPIESKVVGDGRTGQAALQQILDRGVALAGTCVELRVGS
jgi:hypothetical protein